MKKVLLIFTILFLMGVNVFAENQPGLSVGMSAPDFKASNYKGEEVQLSEYIKKGPVVLIFYRGGWCPYCNRQLQELQSRLDDFKKHQASVIAVSVDKIKYAADTVKDKKLDFEVISNPEGDILKLYNLVYKVPDELNDKYLNEYNIDLEAASGRKDHMIAIPATYIINQDGLIVFAYANRDYKIRPSADEILKELEKL